MKPRKNDPDDQDKSGSIEQHLDMVEKGKPKGEELNFRHGRQDEEIEPGLESEEAMDLNYQVDMSEEDREGDELSGDEHSSGYQADEPELIDQPTIESGLPGEEEEWIEHEEKEGKIPQPRRSA